MGLAIMFAAVISGFYYAILGGLLGAGGGVLLGIIITQFQRSQGNQRQVSVRFIVPVISGASVGGMVGFIYGIVHGGAMMITVMSS